jgi:hypothetical protein
MKDEPNCQYLIDDGRDKCKIRISDGVDKRASEASTYIKKNFEYEIARLRLPSPPPMKCEDGVCCFVKSKFVLMSRCHYYQPLK